MKDRIVEDQIRRGRESFVRYLKEDKGESICALASSYHDGTPCSIFTVSHGSFNVCIFVQFDESQNAITPEREVEPGRKVSSNRWVVRIPFPGRVPWIDEKIDSEVATMMYVSQKTTIPIPKIHAWSYEAPSPIGHAFIIMDHVEGTSLSALLFCRDPRWAFNPSPDSRYRSPDLTRVHDQIADVYIQLRDLEFPEIGALGMPTSDSPTIAVRHRPLPMEVALQEVENLDPTAFFPKGKTFQNGREYLEALINLNRNRLVKSRDPDMDSLEVAQHVVFAHDQFYQHMRTTWPRKKKSKPYVLTHGDLSLHGSNLLWDDKLNLVAVLDWEFCHTVPLSFFIPPAWLLGFSLNPIRELCSLGILHKIQLDFLCESIVARSEQHWPLSTLAAEWQRLPREPHCALVLALLYPDSIYDIFWGHLIYHFFYAEIAEKKSQKCLEVFLERPDIGPFLEHKTTEQKQYNEKYELYVREHGEPQDCQCPGCQYQKENFDLLQELRRL